MGSPTADARPARVFLGLGANLGDPVAQLARAVARLKEVLHGVVVSSVYRSEPVGYREQPDFFNLVCGGWTRLSPRELLAHARAVEREAGRVRSFPNSPRPLDVDLLVYGEAVTDDPELTLPHPRMAERAFVLVPLAEVAPEWRHPVGKRTARELLSLASALERIERWGELPHPPVAPPPPDA